MDTTAAQSWGSSPFTLEPGHAYGRRALGSANGYTVLGGIRRR
jgi:hypothetical protein